MIRVHLSLSASQASYVPESLQVIKLGGFEMRTKTTLGLLWGMIFAIINATGAYSQATKTGTLAGTVVDAQSKEPLPGATVLVVGTNNGTATNLEGRYVINGIESGRVKIKFTYVGYKDKEAEVFIKPGVINKLDVALEESAISGKEVIVTAQRQGQQQAITQQLTSNTIVNIVSPDRIIQNPDANAAEAIGRLPGISLIRSGGEGQNIVIRGLDPSYTVIELNGIQLPSNSVDTRTINISGLSEYVLGGISVFKSITPDMEANSVAGAVNLTLARASDRPTLSVIAEPGYNHQKDYFGNYILNADASQRFFGGKLGIKLDIDAERTNRGAQTLGAGYLVNSNVTGGLGMEQVLLNNVSLNNISNIKEKQGGSLVIDWRFSSLSSLTFYNFFSASGAQYAEFTKEYQPFYYNYYDATLDNSGKNLLYNGSLQGENRIGPISLDYGISYSQVHNYDPWNKNWQFRWLTVPYPAQYTTNDSLATLTPQDYVNANLDSGSVSILQSIALWHMGYTSSDVFQKNSEGYLNAKLSFNLTSDVSGYLKVGFEYKGTHRTVNYYSADQPYTSYKYAQRDSNFSWLTVSTASPQPAAYGFVSGSVNNFLSGKYNFGWNVDFSKLDDYWNWWNVFSNKVIEGDSVIKTVGGNLYIGFVPDFYQSSIHNQDVTEDYYAGYLMSEIDLGEVVSFVPGARYEKLTDDLIGYQVYNLEQTYSLYIPRTQINASRSDEFILPNFHLKVKPLDWLAFQAAYTKTLGRPSYQQIVPDIYIDNSSSTGTYMAGNPNLKPEQWSNYDLQVAVFGNEVGLFSVDWFYKEVKDKIWTRTYTRIPTDPVIPNFGANALVNVTETVNHNHLVYVRGVEVEWQTNFWYLPKPFSYFTLNLNYTFLNSETQYPAQRLFTVVTIDSVTHRPKATPMRVDSTVSGRMLNQPNGIGNASLGFEWKGLNLWVSYQYNGDILTSWTNQPELRGRQSAYRRWDMQATLQLPVKGLKLRCDVANINNAQQVSSLVSGPRPTYIESYGWTSDFGVMYNF